MSHLLHFLHLSSYLAEHDRSKASEPTSPGGIYILQPKPPSCRQKCKIRASNQIQREVIPNLLTLTFYLFIYLSSWCHLSHNTEENKKMTQLATAFKTLLHHQLSRYHAYLYSYPYSPQATTHLRSQAQSELQQ